MIEIDSRNYQVVRDLLRSFNYSLSVRAALEGNNPARVFADDPVCPGTVLAITGEGTFLAGDPDDRAVLKPLRRLFRHIFTGTFFPSAEWCIALNVHPAGWVDNLPELVPTHRADPLINYHYLCREAKLDWRSHLPQGYTAQRIDRDVMARLNDPICEWINVEASWGTVENFLSRGVSFCVAHDDEVVSCCNSVCAAGDQVEVGVFTLPGHRRRGLAAAVVAATVETCLTERFGTVGWHCVHDNAGSWKTAEKVGFEREREYPFYFYIFELPDHLSQLAWSCFKRGEYEKTTQYYEQVFALREENPDYYYNCAAEAWGALGNGEMALKYLTRAAQNGWTEFDYTNRVERFQFLHGTPEWEAVMRQIQQNRDSA